MALAHSVVITKLCHWCQKSLLTSHEHFRLRTVQLFWQWFFGRNCTLYPIGIPDDTRAGRSFFRSNTSLAVRHLRGLPPSFEHDVNRCRSLGAMTRIIFPQGQALLRGRLSSSPRPSPPRVHICRRSVILAFAMAWTILKYVTKPNSTVNYFPTVLQLIIFFR